MEGYVLYGWQLAGGEVYIPFQKTVRLNIFGIIDHENNYDRLVSTDNITAKVAGFLDRFFFKSRTRNTFIAPYNALVHHYHNTKELRPAWEKKGLFLFFLPPYSPLLNLAETLRRIFKDKWI